MYRLIGRLGASRVASFTLPSLLSVTVTLSPVMAQNAPVENGAAHTMVCQTAIAQARQPLLRQPAPNALGCDDDSAVSHPIPLNVPSTSHEPTWLPLG